MPAKNPRILFALCALIFLIAATEYILGTDMQFKPTLSRWAASTAQFFTGLSAAPHPSKRRLPRKAFRPWGRRVPQALAIAAVILSTAASPAAAANFSGPVSVIRNGSCTSSDPTILNQTIVISASDFTATDFTIPLPGGGTQSQNNVTIYTVDSAGIIIANATTNIQSSTALPASGFPIGAFSPLTAPGNVIAYLADETDGFPDQAVGATYVPANVKATSPAFNLVALEPDCAFVPSDTTRPRVSSITRNLGNPTNADSVAWTVTFDENVQNVDATDFTVSNTTGSIGVTGSGTTYTVTVSGGDLPSSNAFLRLSFASGRNIQDLAGNSLGNTLPTGTNNATYIMDNIGPAVRLPSLPSTLAASTLGTFIDFDEAVTGFEASDIAGSNFSITNFRPFSSLIYSVTFSITGDGTTTITVPAGVAFDAAGNGNRAGTVSFVSDLTAPSVTLSTTAPDPNNQASVQVDAVFTESVVGFALDDLALTNGVASALTGSGAAYSFTLTPSGDGRVSVQVREDTYQDVAGNGNFASNTVSFVSDRTRPTATVTTTAGATTNLASIPVTVSFSESVTDFLATDLSVTNGTVSGFTGSGTSYSFNVVPASDGTVSVAVPANVAADAATNQNSVSNTLNVTSDRTGPTVALATTAGDPNNLAAVPVTVAFSESVSDFVAGDIAVTNGTVADFTGSGTSYSFNIVPTADGPVSASVAAGLATDGSGNANAVSNTIAFTSDRTGPTVDLNTTAGDPTNLASIPFTVTFSETVTGFDAGDVVVGNGSVVGFAGSGTSYSFNVSPRADGLVTVNIGTNVAADGTGNGNSAATQVSLTSDRSGPSVTLSGTPDFPGTPYTVTITFNEAVTGLDIGEFVTTNVALSGLTGSGTTYTVTATASDFAHSIQLPADAAQDTASNGNAVSNLFENVQDGTPAAVTITGLPATYDPGDVFNVTFTFSEPVSGFDVSDITVAGAVLSGFAGGPSVYTAVITPDGTSNVSVDIAAGAATDVSGQPSSEATASSALNAAIIASRLISDFLDQRARNLVQSQPKLTGFLRGGLQGAAAAKATNSGGTLDFRTGGDQPFWAALSGNWSDSSTGSDSSYVLGVFGGHARVTQNLLVGAMLQYDYAESTFQGGGEVSGTGWLVGPYFVARLPDQPVYFEGSLLWGETDNDISPLGTFTDTFSGERVLATLGVTGEYELDQMTILPSLTLSHVEDKQDAYVDGLANPVPEQTIAITELALGLDFEKPMSAANGSALLTWGVSGIWSSVDGQGAASAFVSDVDNARMRVDLGYVFIGDQGVTFSANAYADGLASGGTRSYGLEAALKFSF